MHTVRWKRLYSSDARPYIPKDSFRHDNQISRMKCDANNLYVFVKFPIRRSLYCKVRRQKRGRNTAASRIINSYQTQVSATLGISLR